MEKSVCPWWMGYLLINPIRKYMHNPKKIVGEYITPGMKVIDYGSAMGYFSLPMARMVGNTGKVYSFDIQPRMLQSLNTRAKRAKLDSIIETRLALDEEAFSTLAETADFALLFAVAHEVPDREKLFKSLAGMLKPNARLLFSEPSGHVSLYNFNQSIAFAEDAGFRQIEDLSVSGSYSILLAKK